MAPIYIKRDPDGSVVAVSRRQLTPEWEEISDQAPELAVFARNGSPPDKELASTDLGLVRVLEDVIDLLIEQGIIRFTDFPEAVQAKLLERRSMRASLRKLDLMGEDNEDEII